MIVISQICETDLAELSALYKELTGKKSNEKKLKENFVWINCDPNYLLIGAKDESKLVGSLMAIVCHDATGNCKPFMVLENVIVKSECRGVGIGKQLINYIENYARQKSCHYIFLVSSNERKNAHKFYESLGYDKDNVRGYKKNL